MKKIVFTLLLIATFAVCVLWVRSRTITDEVGRFGKQWNFICSSRSGIIQFFARPIYRGPGKMTAPFTPRTWQYASESVSNLQRNPIEFARYHQLAWLGAAYDPNYLVRSAAGTYFNGYHFYLPDWLFVLAFLAPLGLRWRRSSRRMQLTRTGCCLNCGYDLRASGTRCPECGTEQVASQLAGRELNGT